MKAHDVIRAQFLMSPYNVREARRAKEWRNMVVGVCFIIIVIMAVAGIMSFLNH